MRALRIQAFLCGLYAVRLVGSPVPAVGFNKIRFLSQKAKSLWREDEPLSNNNECQVEHLEITIKLIIKTVKLIK